MMMLRYSHHSPFARKVVAVAAELGVADRLHIQPTPLRVHDSDLFAQNPLGKVPVLITEEGDFIFDSRTICEYLDVRFGDGKLVPAVGDGRWQAMTWISLADGMIDAALLARQEEARRPELRSEEALRFQLEKVERSLDWFDARLRLEGNAYTLKEISLACAVEWLVFRFGEDFTYGERSRLAAWYKQVKSKPFFAEFPLA
jgi:glutathione S-transferase